MAVDLGVGPELVNLDGVILAKHQCPPSLLAGKRLDDKRLKRGDDILLATYPRTGTTWVGQIVSLMLASDEAYDNVRKVPLVDRVPFLEMTFPGRGGVPEIEKLDDFPTPRALKTHLPFRMVRRWLEEDNLKTIVTTRNPKDTLVSQYHFYQSLEAIDFKGTWDQFFEGFVKTGLMGYGDQLSWYEDWDKNKDKGDILFIQYESLKQDIVAGIKKMADFLGIQLSEKRLENLVRDVNVKQMSKDEAVMKEPNMKEGARFVRTGQSGDRKKYFSAEQNEWFDNKYKAKYEALGLDVDYDQ